jgi:hypothetical protein
VRFVRSLGLLAVVPCVPFAADAFCGACIAARARTWLFSEPKGGATVNVKLPLVFK